MSYIQYILVMVYTHFYANKAFLGTIVLKISNSADVFSVIWHWKRRKIPFNQTKSTKWNKHSSCVHHMNIFVMFCGRTRNILIPLKYLAWCSLLSIVCVCVVSNYCHYLLFISYLSVCFSLHPKRTSVELVKSSVGIDGSSPRMLSKAYLYIRWVTGPYSLLYHCLGILEGTSCTEVEYCMHQQIKKAY